MMNKMNAGSATVDSRATLVVAGAALVILTIAYGAPLLSAVALKPIAAEFGTERAWMLAGRQKRFARYGAGAAALAGYASALALPNATHVALWAMAAVFVAAVTSSTGPAARLFLRRRASNGSSP
jgi:hypothetical protein